MRKTDLTGAHLIIYRSCQHMALFLVAFLTFHSFAAEIQTTKSLMSTRLEGILRLNLLHKEERG